MGRIVFYPIYAVAMLAKSFISFYETWRSTPLYSRTSLAYIVAYSDEEQRWVASCSDYPELIYVDLTPTYAVRGLDKMIYNFLDT